MALLPIQQYPHLVALLVAVMVEVFLKTALLRSVEFTWSFDASSHHAVLIMPYFTFEGCWFGFVELGFAPSTPASKLYVKPSIHSTCWILLHALVFPSECLGPVSSFHHWLSKSLSETDRADFSDWIFPFHSMMLVPWSDWDRRRYQWPTVVGVASILEVSGFHGLSFQFPFLSAFGRSIGYWSTVWIVE